MIFECQIHTASCIQSTDALKKDSCIHIVSDTRILMQNNYGESKIEKNWGGNLYSNKGELKL